MVSGLNRQVMSYDGENRPLSVLYQPDPDVRVVDGVASALHADQLGSIRAITDDAGALAERRVYHPFGEMQAVVVGVAEPEAHGWIGERNDKDTGCNT